MLSADFYDVHQFQVISIPFFADIEEEGICFTMLHTTQELQFFRNRQRIRDQISPPKLIPSKKWACQITEGFGIIYLLILLAGICVFSFVISNDKDDCA